ncbi:MAG TPA: DUF1345 domain-containing protein [Microbacteriaceae bacterium]|nr:DUF1345 domain-containing protein [Microbacteriaceae bacterium]
MRTAPTRPPGAHAPSATETGPERAEHRWPAVIAVVVALVLYGLLPSEFTPWLRYTVVAVCALLLVPLVLLNPLRMRRQTRWSRLMSSALAVVLLIANLIAIGELIVALLSTDQDSDGTLLLAATQVWATHVVVFALLYWELDRGGPVMRALARRERIPRADLRFPQDEDADAVTEVARGSSVRSGWTPNFIDYLYFSAANCMAFSPPDAVPLTSRIKVLVGIQALAAFVVLVLVIARAVALLG